ncbi:MAG TPA: hypothetical protein PLZ51_22160, partial [Aggregatilineales bacterium]|nr:hypothetical protein [Aggregatilineales bacterium]
IDGAWWMRGIGEFTINPPENSWSILVEIITNQGVEEDYWVQVSFVFDTAPQECLFVGQHMYLTDGPTRIFEIVIVDDYDVPNSAKQLLDNGQQS